MPCACRHSASAGAHLRASRWGSRPTVPLPLLQLEWCAAYGAPCGARSTHSSTRASLGSAVPLGTAIAARWEEAGAGGQLLVPVPIHAERRRRRGYDQAVLLAGSAAASLRLPTDVALARERPTRPQFELGRERRAENVADAFRVRDASRSLVAGSWIVLVDDVATTGATLVACAQALLAAGASGVSACTVAREA